MTDLSAYLQDDATSDTAQQPLSVRDNNPSNMRGPEGGFQSFDSPQAGMAAMRDDLLAKVSGNSRAMTAKFGKGYQPTLANVISTWAPPIENDTSGYINYVAKNSGLDPNQPLTAEDVDKIIPHMIKMEGGAKAEQHFSSPTQIAQADGNQSLVGNDLSDQLNDTPPAGRDLSSELGDEPSAHPSILDRLGKAYNKRAADTQSFMQRNVNGAPTTLSQLNALGNSAGFLFKDAPGEAISSSINALPDDVTDVHVPEWVKNGVKGVGSGINDVLHTVADTKVGHALGDAASGAEEVNPRLWHALGTGANLANVLPAAEGIDAATSAGAKGAGNILEKFGKTKFAQDESSGNGPFLELGKKAASKVNPPPIVYDPIATHSAISDAYGAAKAKAGKYYDFMRSMGAGKVVPVADLQEHLSSIISDIKNTPFHEGAPAVGKLQSILKKISGADESPSILDQYGNPLRTKIPETLDVNDLVDLKQLLNSNFNPKRFTLAKDTPYAQLNEKVDDALTEAAKIHPEFGEAKDLADKNWLNTVQNPFQNNPVLQKFWKPEDYFAKQSVDSGRLEELPDQTKQRAATMLSKIKDPIQLNAVRRVLPDDHAETLSKAVAQKAAEGRSAGRLGSAGKAGANLFTGHPIKAAHNILDTLSPGIRPETKALIDEAKSPSPNLSTKYDEPFEKLQERIKPAEETLENIAGKEGQKNGGSIHSSFKKSEFANGGSIIDNLASQANTKPTEAMKAAGNYKKGHIRLHGLNISIENPKDSIRSGQSKDGTKWKSKMPAHYGYIRGTIAKDKQHLDVFVGPKHTSQKVYIIDQHHPDTGKYDEAKAFMGFPSKTAALDAYHQSFSDGKSKQRIGGVTQKTVSEFKHWLANGNTMKPLTKKVG